MRNVIRILGLGILTACHGPQTTHSNPKEMTEPTPTASASRPNLTYNTNPKVPIVTSFGNGTLRVTGGCLVFATSNGLYTPLWPLGTDWDGTGSEIVTPRGGRYAIGKPITLPGGQMGSTSGSDLRPSLAPSKECPADFFAVHPN